MKTILNKLNNSGYVQFVGAVFIIFAMLRVFPHDVPVPFIAGLMVGAFIMASDQP